MKHSSTECAVGTSRRIPSSNTALHRAAAGNINIKIMVLLAAKRCHAQDCYKCSPNHPTKVSHQSNRGVDPAWSLGAPLLLLLCVRADPHLASAHCYDNTRLTSVLVLLQVKQHDGEKVSRERHFNRVAAPSVHAHKQRQNADVCRQYLQQILSFYPLLLLPHLAVRKSSISKCSQASAARALSWNMAASREASGHGLAACKTSWTSVKLPPCQACQANTA